MSAVLDTLTRWLDRIPLPWAVLGTAWLAAAPFVPEPHLLEKLRMLAQGTLVRPLDVFDLVMHGTTLLLLLPLLMFPVVAPVVISATRETEAAFGVGNADIAEGWPWVGILLVFAALFGVGGTMAFGALIEE